MFQSLTNMGLRLPAVRSLKAVAPAVVLALGLIAAPVAAEAATYVIQDVDMTSPRTLRLSGSGFTTTNVKATPVQFDGFIQGSPNQPFENLVAFCVDVFHSIALKEYNPGLTYTDEIELEHNSHWDPNKREFLSDQEVLQIGKLVNYGTQVFYNVSLNSNVRLNELAAVQGAIWKVASGLTVAANTGSTSTNNAINARLTALSNAANYTSAFTYKTSTVKGGIALLTPFKDGRYPKDYPHKSLTQSFAIAAVPEPGTWTLMIGGFALAGGMIRRSRRQAFAIRH